MRSRLQTLSLIVEELQNATITREEEVGQSLRGHFSEGNGILRAFPRVELVLLVVAALVLILFPEFAREVPVVPTVYWTAAIFAGMAILNSILWGDSVGQTLWIILGCGVVIRLAGDMARGGFNFVDSIPQAAIVDYLAHASSSLLIFGALIWLISRTSKHSTLVATGDALCIALSTTVLISYFLGSLGAGVVDWVQILVALSGPGLTLGLVYLGIAYLFTKYKTIFIELFAGAVAALAVAGLLHLFLQSSNSYGAGGWADLVECLGVALLGFAALRPASFNKPSPQLAISPRRTLFFWLGPLSPPLHYGFLLCWMAFNPPISRYAVLGGAVIMIYFALRTFLVSQINHELLFEGQMEARKEEQSRISSELHDTLKQSVHTTALLLGSCWEARTRGKQSVADEALKQAMETSREANHQISSPIDELRFLCTASELDYTDHLQRLLEDTGKRFKIRIHTDLRTDLNKLNAGEAAAAYRIASEALWNAAKHSSANNIWLVSKEEESVVLVEVRDDGCGFCVEGISASTGLSLMQERAAESGGDLNVISYPPSDDSDGGTVVQVKFDRKGVFSNENTCSRGPSCNPSWDKNCYESA